MRCLKGIGINVILLGIVSFITDISTEMMMAILPMFITSLGGAGIAIGLIGGIGEGVSSILNVFSGLWSDKLCKRKIFAFLGYLLSSIAKLFFPFSQSWWNLVILRPIERVGKGLRTAPRDAIIANSCVEETKGKAFGIHRAADTSGAFVGVLLAFIFYWMLHLDFRPILMVSAVIAFFALIPFFWIKEKSDSEKVKAIERRLTFKISLKDTQAGFKTYLIAAVLFSLSNFTYMFFILRAMDEFKKVFPIQLAQALPLLLYLWFNIIYALMAIPAGILADRNGRKKVLIIGYLVYSLTCLGFFGSHSIGAFIIFFAIYGFSFALIEGNQRAFASDFATEDTRGTILGMFHAAISLSSIASGLIAGLLWNCNSQYPFIYGVLLSLLAVIIIAPIKTSASEY